MIHVHCHVGRCWEAVELNDKNDFRTSQPASCESHNSCLEPVEMILPNILGVNHIPVRVVLNSFSFRWRELVPPPENPWFKAQHIYMMASNRTVLHHAASYHTVHYRRIGYRVHFYLAGCRVASFRQRMLGGFKMGADV